MTTEEREHLKSLVQIHRRNYRVVMQKIEDFDPAAVLQGLIRQAEAERARVLEYEEQLRGAK